MEVIMGSSGPGSFGRFVTSRPDTSSGNQWPMFCSFDLRHRGVENRLFLAILVGFGRRCICPRTLLRQREKTEAPRAPAGLYKPGMLLLSLRVRCLHQFTAKPVTLRCTDPRWPARQLWARQLRRIEWLGFDQSVAYSCRLCNDSRMWA